MHRCSVGGAFRKRLPFAIMTATSFAVFGFTLCPTVFAGDAGELGLAAQVLGIAHPPGYPIFVMLGRMFGLIGGALAPDSTEPIWFTNLLSACLAAFTVGVTYLLLERLLPNRFFAAAGAGILAFSSVLWGQATITEVYALVALVTACLLLTLESLDRTGRASTAYLLAYLAGISLVVHQGFVLFMPVFVFVLWRVRRIVSPARAGAMFVFGLSPLLFLVVRAPLNPGIHWGAMQGAGDLAGVLLRRNYGELAQNPLTRDLLLGNVQGFVRLVVDAFPIALLAAAPLGLMHLARVRRRFCLVTTLMFVSFLVGVTVIVRPFPDRVHLYQLSFVYTPLYCMIAVWIGAGMFAAFDNMFQAFRTKRPPVRKWLSPLVLIAPLFMLVLNFAENDRRDFFDARVYGENILRSIPEGGVLVLDGDNESFILAYLVYGLGERDDITLYHRRGLVFDAPEYVRRSTRADLASRSRRWVHEILEVNPVVYFAGTADLSGVSGWQLVREGIVRRAMRTPGVDVQASTTNPAGVDVQTFAMNPAGVDVQATATNPAGVWPYDAAAVRRRDGALLASYDTSVLDRPARSLDFLVRKFAIGYLQSRWEYAAAAGDTGACDKILRSIGEVGYDFAEASFFVALEMERRGDLVSAYAAYRRSARLSPLAPYPWVAMTRVRELLDARGIALD